MGPIGVAVSGGGDSLALMCLAADWAKARSRSLLAMTFDHRLRAESAEEARHVSRVCAQVGVLHEILEWNDPVPRQAAARRARHSELAIRLSERGGSHLLFGHTLDDQIETLVMRARHGSTWYGLAGMQSLSPSPVWPEGAGVAIVRPLLDVTRTQLREDLRGRGIDWIDDPSNRNEAFERIHVRQMLNRAPARAARIERCLTGLQGLRVIDDVLLGRWMRANVRAEEDHVAIDLSGLPLERAARALGVMIPIVGEHDRRPRQDRLMRLAKRLQSHRPFSGATLGGVKFEGQVGDWRLKQEGSSGAKPGARARTSDRIHQISDILCGCAATNAAP